MRQTVTLDIETTGLGWIEHQITCVCAKDSDGNKFREAVTTACSEADLIIHFGGWLYPRKDNLLLSFNGKGFDLPFILGRAALLDLDVSKLKFMLQMDHEDLMLITKKWVSLNAMAKILKLPTKNGNGRDAIAMYHAGEYEKLLDYCMGDVLLTEAIYLRRKQLEPVEALV